MKKVIIIIITLIKMDFLYLQICRKMRIVLFFALFMSLISCKEKMELPEININAEIEDYQKLIGKSKDVSIFNIEQKLAEDKWNHLLIIYPYAKEKVIKKLQLKGYRKIKDEIFFIQYFDSYCLFIFLNDNSIVAYSKVKSNLLESLLKKQSAAYYLIEKK